MISYFLAGADFLYVMTAGSNAYFGCICMILSAKGRCVCFFFYVCSDSCFVDVGGLMASEFICFKQCVFVSCKWIRCLWCEKGDSMFLSNLPLVNDMTVMIGWFLLNKHSCWLGLLFWTVSNNVNSRIEACFNCL